MQYFINCVNSIAPGIRKLLLSQRSKGRFKASSFFEINIVCDEHGLIYYLIASLFYLRKKGMKLKINVISKEFPQNSELIDSIYEEYIVKRTAEDKESLLLTDIVCYYSSFNDYKNTQKEYVPDESLFAFMINTNNEKYHEKRVRTAKLEYINGCLKYISESEGRNRVVVSEFMPAVTMLPYDNPDIAEREYEFYGREAGEDSLEYFPVAIEDVLRNYDVEDLHVKVVRFPDVFGPKIKDNGFLTLDKIAEQVKGSNLIAINSSEYKRRFSIVYAGDALKAFYTVFIKGKDGNIYNVSQYRTNMYSVSLDLIRTLKPYGVELEIKNDSSDKSDSFNYAFASKKVRKIGWKPKDNMKGQLAHTILDKLDKDLRIENMDDIKYDRKLTLIKQLELDAVKEIDRICKQHDIKYFLIGGSLLGAVRHQGFISWDDDLDIGMLREDFEKFRKVAPSELDKKYAYQSYTDEPDTHYIFDKIRLKDTYFSTKFSSMFNMENGIFIDILVYDKTSNDPKKQKRHIRNLIIWRRAINVRWVNRPRKNIHYKLTKFALPFMRKVPFRYFHKIFESILTMYNKDPNNQYLIDGVGQNLNKGAFPASWFDELIELPFEDMMLPVPAEYDQYLKHWYGKRYMELPPISSRFSGHDLANIDLGPYVIPNHDKYEYHKNDFRGELFT